MTVLLTIIMAVCSFLISFSLLHAGHGLDSWLFWIIFVCYITVCVVAMIREYQLLNAAEIARRKAQRKRDRAVKRELKKFHVGDVGFPFDRLKLRGKLNSIEKEFQEEVRKTVIEEFDLPKGFYNNED